MQDITLPVRLAPPTVQLLSTQTYVAQGGCAPGSLSDEIHGDPLSVALRGENIHYVKSNGTDKPERLKVRAPTLANYPATVVMLRKGFIADIPLIFAAIDPCICCAERAVTLVNARSGRESVVLMSELRRWALDRAPQAPVKGKAVWPF